MIRVFAALTFGALVMLTATEPVDGQEKKDPGLKAPFDQYVKVEGTTAKGESLVKEQVPAYRGVSLYAKEPYWAVPTRSIGTPTEWKGMRSVVITDKDGKKHQCESPKDMAGGTGRLSFRIVEPKP